tara:strand:+ start:1680 stop:2780 length:1101 start_codon:yes stop_codon:yes gene_type:complete
MASTFKTFISDDIANTRTLLHEAIPITGSIVNGATYTDNQGEETNIKTYGHGMFQSVYDYPYASSSANHIFDMALGCHEDASGSDITHPFYNKRKNIYSQMAQVLVGHKVNGEVRKFDVDGDLTGGTEYNSLLFINFARLLGKDEIKKGTFSITLGTGSVFTERNDETDVISDDGNESDYKVNSPAGEYSVLRMQNPNGNDPNEKIPCGLIYYQAGIVVLDSMVLHEEDVDPKQNNGYHHQPIHMLANGTQTIEEIINDISISTDAVLTAVRQRIVDIQFSNTTELNSTIYFCRVGHNDFNYSSNPTYLENSKIKVKNKTTDAPVSYITTVGLYSADNEMLAVAKLSEPLRKDPTNDITLRVRLDY